MSNLRLASVVWLIVSVGFYAVNQIIDDATAWRMLAQTI
jgi:hypothetical protein